MIVIVRSKPKNPDLTGVFMLGSRVATATSSLLVNENLILLRFGVIA